VTKLEQKLRAALRQMSIGTDVSLIVAVSGGADSVALLDALLRLRKHNQAPQTIQAAHLNHQLRGEESDGDENFVREMAASLDIRFIVDRIAVGAHAQAERQNLEAMARRLRYEFLTRSAEEFGAQFVCTAHTQDDQAETVLMRLLRGSGTDGLRGVHSIRPLSKTVKLIRPLLSVSRTEVIAHCAYHKLEFRSDSSNFSLDFTRNRIRHELMPLLRSFNPRADEALARTADLSAGDQDFLGQISADVLAEARLDLDLDMKLLRKQPTAIRRRVLRLWLSEHRAGLQRIEAVHLEAIEQLIARGHGGRTIELPGGWRVWLKSGRLKIAQLSGET
jgi:tRNA(Ile)-lysidine synthase